MDVGHHFQIGLSLLSQGTCVAGAATWATNRLGSTWVMICNRTWVFKFTLVFVSLSVMADRKEISEDVFDNINKFLPILRQPDIGLARAADYLEAWLAGTLPKQPPLCLRGCLDWRIVGEGRTHWLFDTYLAGKDWTFWFSETHWRCEFGEMLRPPFHDLEIPASSFFVRPNRLRYLVINLFCALPLQRFSCKFCDSARFWCMNTSWNENWMEGVYHRFIVYLLCNSSRWMTWLCLKSLV